MINFQQAENLILAEKKLAISRGRSEDSWFFYHNHVYGCAAVARAIAENIGLDAEFAAIYALLHDIGKIRESIDCRFHGVIGYNMLKDMDERIARSCVVHTFPENKIDGYARMASMFFEKKDDYDFTAEFLEKHPVNDYDRLVQLCDDLANAYGFVTLEQRAEEYARRHNIPITDTLGLIERVKDTKSYFDRKLGKDVYTLFEKINTKNLFLAVV